jgi:CrcB protein|tara:strand:+ start:26405 stop:26758 length:354 start_codon:yes stop_codon:yes gene_type:complete
MNPYVLVATGGSLGAVSRYIVSDKFTFPHGTTAVNTAGSFALGLLISKSLQGGLVGEKLALLLGVGFLGAFTTLSTFSVDLLGLINEGRMEDAVGYFMSNTIGGPLMAYLGFIMGGK